MSLWINWFNVLDHVFHTNIIAYCLKNWYLRLATYTDLFTLKSFYFMPFRAIYGIERFNLSGRVFLSIVLKVFCQITCSDQFYVSFNFAYCSLSFFWPFLGYHFKHCCWKINITQSYKVPNLQVELFQSFKYFILFYFLIWDYSPDFFQKILGAFWKKQQYCSFCGALSL